MRARNLKPSIFKNEYLARLASDSYRAFTGLWCLADRKGRLEDRPDRIEAELFPFKFQNVDMEKILVDLSGGQEPFIIRYESNQKRYIQIINFEKHQYPHHREQESTIPAPGKPRAFPKQAHLNPLSPFPLPESPIPIKTKTIAPAVPKPAKPQKQKEEPLHFWKELVAHIDLTWLAKKKTKFFWRPQHFKNLKSMASLYQPWGVMALWDAYLGSKDEWAWKMGYSFETFCSQIPKLVDDSFWKMGAQRYEEKLNGAMPTMAVVLKEKV